VNDLKSNNSLQGDSMSRIHEALKKAEQEKHAQMPVSTNQKATQPIENTSPSVSNKYAVEELPHEVRQVDRSSVLKFEDLVQRCARPEWNADSTLRVSLAGDSGKIVAERFRTLRSRLYQIAGVKPLKRVLVTSSMPAEGKTFVVTNLVRSLIRQADRRVLTIDADLRAPRLHTALGAPGTPGLSDYLRGQADEYSIIQYNASNNLCFIPCGTKTSNPSELLLSDRMKALLDTITPAFDWVIIDSPPALPVHDSSSLADICDGVLFVVRAGQTSHEDAKKASMEFRHKNILGTVLNQVDSAETPGDYYYGRSEK
jgi:protein-tyrosine kinase